MPIPLFAGGDALLPAPLERELFLLDAAVARRVGPAVAAFGADGIAYSPDGSRYRPSSDASTAEKLMNNYVRRLARLAHTWIAVGMNGRAEEGATSMIATCKVVANSATLRS